MLPAANVNSPQRLLGELFRNTVLAWAKAGELIPVMADPLWPAGRGVQITSLKDTDSPLHKTRFSLGDTEWPELGLHSYPYPCLICVIEGEADIRIGTVPQTSKDKNSAQTGGLCIFVTTAQLLDYSRWCAIFGWQNSALGKNSP